jgi:branched-chain amino acid transport system substrate-binding protein
MTLGVLTIGVAGSAGAASTSSTPIKLGVIGGFTGPLAATVYATPPAIKAWADYVNAHGGINGHPVQLTIEDDQTNPAISTADAQKLVADHVVAIFDDSDFDSQWGSYVTSNHLPILPTNSSTVGALNSDNFFTAGPTINTLPAAIAAAAKKVNTKKMGLLYCAESPDCSQLVQPIKTDAASSGVDLVYDTSISATAPSYTAPCLAAESAGAKSLFIGDAVSVLLSVAKDCVTQGYKPLLIGDDGAVAPDFATAPGWSNDMIAVQPNIPFSVKDTPATKTMYDAFDKYQPGFTSNPNYNELGVETWTAGLLFQAAATAGKLGVSGAPTTTEVYNGLYSAALKGTTLGGMVPPLDFVQGKVFSNGCWFFMRTQDGHFTTPYGLTPECLSSSSPS